METEKDQHTWIMSGAVEVRIPCLTVNMMDQERTDVMDIYLTFSLIAQVSNMCVIVLSYPNSLDSHSPILPPHLQFICDDI